MKISTCILLAVLLALPALAGDPAALSQPAAIQDSPLVAAAKRSGRLSKKPALVITNEMLGRVGSAHFTLADSQGPLDKVDPSAPNMSSSNSPAEPTASGTGTAGTTPMRYDAEAMKQEGRSVRAVCSTCPQPSAPIGVGIPLNTVQPTSNAPRPSSARPPGGV